MVSSSVLSDEARIRLPNNPGLRLIGFLHGLFGLLGSSGELPEILSRFLCDLGEYLEAEGGFILATTDPTNLRLLAEFGAPFREEEHDPAAISRFYDELIRKQRPALASGATSDARSIIGVPLVTEKRLIGVVVFFRHERFAAFIAEDIPLLSVVAQPLAIHLENVDFARVTSARRAELEAILSSMEDGLLVVDRMGEVLSFNNSLERLSRYSAAELYGLSWEDLLTTSSPRLETFRAFNRSLRVGEVFSARCPGSLKTNEGQEIPVSVNFNTIVEDKGSITGGVLSIRDMTFETQVDRMKDEFIANVSHELKTPITTISGFLQMMLGREMQRSEMVPLLDVLKGETDRLHRLINDLLELSKIQAGRIRLTPRKFRLELLLKKSARPLMVRHQDSHRFLFEVKPPRGMILADHDRLMQVMVNLVSNAVKYSPEGGAVRITAERRKDWWHIAVQDEGIGIPVDALGQLFTRFYRVNENQTSGSGLGLFITKEIVERHGGRLEVESAEGKGSTFTVHLPAKGPAEMSR